MAARRAHTVRSCGRVGITPAQWIASWAAGVVLGRVLPCAPGAVRNGPSANATAIAASSNTRATAGQRAPPHACPSNAALCAQAIAACQSGPRGLRAHEHATRLDKRLVQCIKLDSGTWHAPRCLEASLVQNKFNRVPSVSSRLVLKLASCPRGAHGRHAARRATQDVTLPPTRSFGNRATAVLRVPVC